MNKLRTEIEEEEAEKQLIVEEKPGKEIPDNLLMQFFTKGVFQCGRGCHAGRLPFILFVGLLGWLYIANRHLAEKNIRDIDKIPKR